MPSTIISKLFTLFFVAVMPTPLHASRTILADSVADYSSEQGEFGWLYGFYTGTLNPTGFELLPNFQDGKWEIDSAAPSPFFWTFLSETGGHPNGEITSQGRDSATHWVVRRWISSYSGKVEVCGSVSRKFPEEGSNGVIARIFHNDSEIFSQQVVEDSAKPIEYRVSVILAVGDTLDFVVDPRETNDLGDTFEFRSRVAVYDAIADSVGDFSATQGDGGWSYGFYTSPFRPMNFELLSSYIMGPEAGRWTAGDNYWLTLDAIGGHPNGVITTAPKLSEDRWAVRRYTSSRKALVTVSGSASLRRLGTRSNGVVVKMFHNATEVMTNVVKADDVVGISYEKTIQLNIGDTLDFVISPRDSNDWGDTTNFTAWIREVQAPTLDLYHHIEGNVRIEFSGFLEESSDLVNWSPVRPTPTSPYIYNSNCIQKFFRASLK